MSIPPASFNSLIVQEFWVRTGVSVVTLLFAVFVIASPRFKPAQKHWAYGVVGIILGYWLRP